ncbi:hypothetical protein BST34_27945 [Mycolicibacterium monacense DSM 44395]|nr:hypothetical protein BST34_27945 [Mycolicibacterium monacense DSM 44395]
MIHLTSIDTHCSGCLHPAPADDGDPEASRWLVISVNEDRDFLAGAFLVVCPACHQQALE